MGGAQPSLMTRDLCCTIYPVAPIGMMQPKEKVMVSMRRHAKYRIRRIAREVVRAFYDLPMIAVAATYVVATALLSRSPSCCASCDNSQTVEQ